MGRLMAQEHLEKIRKYEANPKTDAKSVKLFCIHGNVLEGFILFVDDEHRDVLFDVLLSTNSEKYKRGSCYTIRWDDIVDFHPLGD